MYKKRQNKKNTTTHKHRHAVNSERGTRRNSSMNLLQWDVGFQIDDTHTPTHAHGARRYQRERCSVNYKNLVYFQSISLSLSLFKTSGIDSISSWMLCRCWKWPSIHNRIENSIVHTYVGRRYTHVASRVSVTSFHCAIEFKIWSYCDGDGNRAGSQTKMFAYVFVVQ